MDASAPRPPVFLIGMMGAGKTTVGRRLAARLGRHFVDSDEEVEKAAGMSIEDIFAAHGEADFRAGEVKVIARLLKESGIVLGTGGGAFMNAETRAAIKAHGVSVWLKAELQLLMRRVMRRDNRPLLKNADPEAVMRRLMVERYPVYAEADVTVESRDVPHEVILDDILAALRPALTGPTAAGTPLDPVLLPHAFGHRHV
jgi:shikimate kinase